MGFLSLQPFLGNLQGYLRRESIRNKKTIGKRLTGNVCPRRTQLSVLHGTYPIGAQNVFPARNITNLLIFGVFWSSCAGT